MKDKIDNIKVSIYALINPLDNSVFYIGASINPEERLKRHVWESKYCYSEKEKIIFNIINKGLCVELLILDTCRFIDVDSIEHFYIDLFKSFGFKLTQMPQTGYYSSQYTKVKRNFHELFQYTND